MTLKFIKIPGIMIYMIIFSCAAFAQAPDINKLLGTLPAGKSIVVTYEVTIKESTPMGTAKVSNQATVSGSNFTLKQTNLLDMFLADPLPVELVDFSANVNQNDVELKWNTATEVNNHGFDIERKQISTGDLKTEWIEIGFMQGHGNSNSPKEYNYTDKKVKPGRYTYRLRQIDTDGKFSYSYEQEAEVIFNPKSYALMQNYPNPFNPTTKISYTLLNDSHVKLSVYNTLGQEVGNLVNETQQSGVYYSEWNAGELSSGIYIYILETNSLDGKNIFKSAQKMILMK